MKKLPSLRDGLADVIAKTSVEWVCARRGAIQESYEEYAAAHVRAYLRARLGGTRIHRSDGLHNPEVPCCWHRGWKAAMTQIGLDEKEA